MLLMMLSGFDLDAALRIDNAMWQQLTKVDELYGAAAALWILSAAAPVGEEFIFRGLLLRASLRHVSFPVANGLQALLFAAMHFDLPRCRSCSCLGSRRMVGAQLRGAARADGHARGAEPRCGYYHT